jgi:hypothetical protein
MTGLWITAGLCVLMAVLLFCGKGGFIIIGYNTAPPEVKATFNRKKLYRAVGVLFLVLAAMTAAAAMWFELLHKVYTYAMVIAIAACMFYCLGYCRTQQDGAGQDDKEKDDGGESRS